MTLTVEQAIRNRRTTKAAAMNGKKIPDEQITELLELARWAPNHGRTEPWQFIVYSGDALQNFARDHARLYWENTPEDKRLESTRDRLEAGMQTVSHLIIAIMKRGGNPKIPVFEEIAAASAAVQNILLAATANGISSFWSTGGMTNHPALKTYLSLSEEDLILGMIHLGYSDEPVKPGSRIKTNEAYIDWRS